MRSVLAVASLSWLPRLLRRLIIPRLENLFDRTMFRSSVVALCFGFVLTVIVQSGSVTTSIVVPLVGAGVLSIRQVFPYTMGANVGTTITVVLAGLAAYGAAMPAHAAPIAVSAVESARFAQSALAVSFLFVLFNVAGVAVLWFVRGIPIAMAEGFARVAMRNRAIPVAYIVVTFYVVPFLVIWLAR